MERLQYDALWKCTVGVKGARRETVREIAAVEDVDTFAEAACGRFLVQACHNSMAFLHLIFLA